MFSHIAARYEWVDHVASLGQDYLWRPRALWELDRFHRGPVRRVLDVGCGTGALARLFAHRYPEARVVAADFSPAMVRRARGATPAAAAVDYAVGNIGRLPFADATFDVVASAFVARNLVDLDAGFRELRRVLRAGGTALTLDISEPRSPTVARLFHAHFDRAVPMIGRAFGREGPYRYLPQSLRAFPPAERFRRTLVGAGFPRTAERRMSLGIVTAYLSAASGPSDASD